MGELRIEPVAGDRMIEDWQVVHNAIIPTDPLSLEDVRERVRRNHLEVAYLGDEVVGCSTVRPPSEETPAVTVIARVLPQYRRQGFGEQLYRRGLAKAEEVEAEAVETIILASNLEGLEFAQRRGFVEIERYVLPGDTIPFITLRLSTHSWLTVADAEHVAAIRREAGRYAEGGVLHLALEVIAYPLDEAAEGTTDRVLVTLHDDGSISVEDNGRGTFVRFDDDGVPMVKPIMATRDLRFFQIPDAPVLPDGRRRSGMSVVAALSEWVSHTNRRTECSWTQRYGYGLPRDGLTELPPTGTTGTIVHFRPEPAFFGAETITAEALRATCTGFGTTVPIEITTAD
ncbi:acetyltransferase (GNAT) family protein [Kribbella sp. VKM Ac-2527]|uniref:DNA topoisomerase (ATP-hydrolyzing) n=1 Tax=Kribbella caucasensis TaxID=2512215 RepID=A0A4R6KDK4_9ACTN|nr:GNAT family N-acetyltransferase [Kribbella sp. VKM Ac-2527]TDO45945.1 acetyltransferase (GNAT) family protein [Kribbella sp. VKM Ac-2527]